MGPMTRPLLPQARWLLCLFALLAGVGCQPHRLVAVGAPDAAGDAPALPDGGVALPAPDGGCPPRDASAQGCPSGSQLTFDDGPVTGFSTIDPELSNLRVSCSRSFCGGGSLAFAARYTWDNGGDGRLGEVVYTLPQPLDLAGKYVWARVRYEPDETPMNALLAVTTGGRFRRLWDGWIHGDWNSIGAVIPVPPEGGAVLVTMIRIQVYLSVPVLTGTDTWTGQIYIDEIGWGEVPPMLRPMP